MIKAIYHHDIYRNVMELFITDQKDDGKRLAYEGCVIREVDHGQVQAKFLDGQPARDFLQAMANCAFDNGIFPQQISDKKDELKATKYHLEDMRKLVFKGSPNDLA